MLIDEDTHSYEMMAAMRAGFRLDSPGYPNFFGFLGRAWPVSLVPTWVGFRSGSSVSHG